MPNAHSDTAEFVPDLSPCEVGVKSRATTLISLLKYSGFTITDVISRETSANIVFFETGNINIGSLHVNQTHVSLEVFVNDYEACVIGKSEFTFTGDAADNDVLIITYIRGMCGLADYYLKK